ncbi:MAG TPA: host-nuclease inhibitor Gam family protein [Candidatus Acidoferrum sp.]|nr:host-nuclease inhibitor Gam family protein [Candidatus Acidoferrum sp.]
MISNTESVAGAAIDQSFARLVERQQEFTDVTLALEKLEVKMSDDALKAAGKYATEYVVLQERLAKLDGEIAALFLSHPEWREKDQKTVKTPYGSVEQRKATKLEVNNEALTVALIKARGIEDPKFNAALFLHVEESPNLEALEGLDDTQLLKLGVARKTNEKITVKPAKVEAAKAVKAAKST